VTAPEEVYAPGPPDDEVPGPPPPMGPTKKKRSTTRSVVEWVAVVGGALVVALVIRAFFLAAFYIPSESMVPTLQKGDRVLVNKLSYKLHDVHRGDVVVFGRPPAEQDSGIKDLIKRVIGLPGETVEGRGGDVYVNGRRLVEPYLPPGVRTSDFAPTIVPKGTLWVMGDNRGNSEDSRRFGTIRRSTVLGRTIMRIWPFSRAGFL
jgi:signal peptidase I